MGRVAVEGDGVEVMQGQGLGMYQDLKKSRSCAQWLGAQREDVE